MKLAQIALCLLFPVSLLGQNAFVPDTLNESEAEIPRSLFFEYNSEMENEFAESYPYPRTGLNAFYFRHALNQARSQDRIDRMLLAFEEILGGQSPLEQLRVSLILWRNGISFEDSQGQFWGVERPAPPEEPEP